VLPGLLVVAGTVSIGAGENLTAVRFPAAAGESVADRRALVARLDDARGTLTIYRLELDRAQAVIAFSGRYRIPADRAALIYDVAAAEGVDAGLAFSLVQVESSFDPRAKSRTGAIGLTQILPSTARLYRPDLSLEQLYEPATNLRLGFHFLHDLLRRFQSVDHALVAYSLGPVKLRERLAGGMDVRTAYSRTVASGFQR
jgi:soluble lytic murein transglycosylase-like protein